LRGVHFSVPSHCFLFVLDCVAFGYFSILWHDCLVLCLEILSRLQPHCIMKRKQVMLSFDDDELAGAATTKATRSISQNLSQQQDSAPSFADDSRCNDGGPSADHKSKREYAWMDSEDESNSDGSGAGHSEDDRQPVVELPASIGSVETFGEFVRLTPALKSAVPDLAPAELTALCETAARLRHFDADLFSDVFKQLSVRIKARELDTNQVTAVATALVELNAYDAGVFRASAALMVQYVPAMPEDERLHWLKLLAATSHQGDATFIAVLKSTPLPSDAGPEGDAPQSRVCYEWMGSGFCPRGNRCQFAHTKERVGSSRRKGVMNKS